MNCAATRSPRGWNGSRIPPTRAWSTTAISCVSACCRLLERFPGAAAAIARAAHNLAQAADICAERTREDLAACAGTDRYGQPYLGLAPWQRLSGARADALLRAWLAMHTATTPDARALQTLREEVIAARADAQPALVLGDIAIRRYRERIYAVAAHQSPPVAGIVLAPGESARIEGAGLLELQRCSGAGVRPGREHRIGFGSPALRCRPVGRPGKTLGQLAQEYGVPPGCVRGCRCCSSTASWPRWRTCASARASRRRPAPPGSD